MFDAETDQQVQASEVTGGTASCKPAGTVFRAAAAGDRLSLAFADLAADAAAPFAIDAHAAAATFPLRRVRAGESLFRTGDHADSIYIVRAGFLKTTVTQPNGIEQIVAFPGRGDAVGLDGIASGRHATDVRALDTSVVAVVSLERIETLSREHPAIDRFLHHLFGREMARKQQMVWLLGMLTADARVAAFLLQLSRTFARFGQSPSSFLLRMSRHEIGSHLGIKLETVSRTLSALAAAGLIDVSHRTITLKDIDGLHALLGARATASRPAPAYPPRRRTTLQRVGRAAGDAARA